MKCTKENMKKLLEEIGWGITEVSNRFSFIFDHNGNNTGNYLFGENPDKIEIALKKEHMACCFYLKDSKVELLDTKDAVCVSAKDNDSVFILFMNHNVKK